MAVTFSTPSSRCCIIAVTLVLVLFSVTLVTSLLSTTSTGSDGSGVLHNLHGYASNMHGYASDQLAPLVNKLKTMSAMRFYIRYDTQSDNQTQPVNDTLPFGEVPEISADEYKIYSKYMLSESMHKQIFRCLDVFQEVADSVNMTWWMSFGTLLGSYRHHGMIPWDADMDVIADIRKKEDFRNEFHARVKKGMYKDVDLWSEMPWDKVIAVPGYYGTPFVDVFWYRNVAKVKVHVEATFPLRKRPLGAKLYPAPKDPRDYISRMYGDDFDRVCTSGHFDYIEKHPKPAAERIKRLCAALVKKFPFVRHTRGEGGSYCKEELVMRGRVLTSFIRSSKGIPIC